MQSMLSGSNKVVGAKQVLKAVEAGEAVRVFIASDADVFVTRRVYDACREKGVQVTEVPSMRELGEACGVQVKAAAAAVKR